jgi:adenylosuccinate lyase
MSTRNFNHETYLSPFTWRYGSAEMRALWGEAHRRRLWRRIWVALAQAQAEAGLVSEEQVADLRDHAGDVDLARAHAIEQEIHHDLMAEIRTFAEQCDVGGRIIHLGATSTDVEDNADALRLREGLDILLRELRALLCAFATQVEAWAATPTMAFTHLQPAEPTTIGYRLAQYTQDLMEDYRSLGAVRGGIRGKGIKGAVGTSASYAQLMLGREMDAAGLERRVMAALGLDAFPVTTQTYPRKQDYRVLAALAGMAASIHKFAFDLRFLQTPPIGEWAEPFAARQVGSSAMPFKRNPVNAENLDSLARELAALPRIAWDNAANSLLERTLDDSANRRTLLPEAFLIADELLRRCRRIVEGMHIEGAAAQRLLAAYGPFAATERLLMELVRRGGDRQGLHEILREHALAAWAEVQAGRANPLVTSLGREPAFRTYATPAQVRGWLNAADYTGDAEARARALVAEVRTVAGCDVPARMTDRGEETGAGGDDRHGGPA